MIQVVLNGQDYSLEDSSTVASLLNKLELEGKLAIEINRNIVHRSCFETQLIHAGDTIEIVHAIGGG